TLTDVQTLLFRVPLYRYQPLSLLLRSVLPRVLSFLRLLLVRRHRYGGIWSCFPTTLLAHPVPPFCIPSGSPDRWPTTAFVRAVPPVTIDGHYRQIRELLPRLLFDGQVRAPLSPSRVLRVFYSCLAKRFAHVRQLRLRHAHIFFQGLKARFLRPRRYRGRAFLLFRPCALLTRGEKERL